MSSYAQVSPFISLTAIAPDHRSFNRLLQVILKEMEIFQKPRDGKGNIFLVEPRGQRGIHCRFGMPGVRRVTSDFIQCMDLYLLFGILRVQLMLCVTSQALVATLHDKIPRQAMLCVLRRRGAFVTSTEDAKVLNGLPCGRPCLYPALSDISVMLPLDLARYDR